MGVRKNLELELEQLKEKLLFMGKKAEAAFIHAVEALQEQDIARATQIIAEDEEVNKLDEEIENMIVKIIASQQPVASDLRMLMSAIKISTSMERIGDFAVDISKAILHLGEEKGAIPLQDILLMTGLVQKMLHESLEVFAQEQIESVHEIAKLDDQVDALYAQTVQQLLSVMINKPEHMDHIIQVAFIARYIERIADHVTNILEAVLYSVKGKRLNLNQ